MSEASSGDRVSPLRLLKARRQKEPHNNLPDDPSTEGGRDAIEAFIEQEVDEQKIVTSTRIARALEQAGLEEHTDVSTSEIGRTLGAYVDGKVEDESFASNVEISIWRDSNQPSYQIDRISGRSEGSTRGMFLEDLIEAVDAAAEVDVELTRTADGNYHINREWMRAVTRKLVDQAGASEEQLEEIETAPKRGLTEILVRHTDVDVAGARDQWSKTILEDIHELLGGDQS